MRRLLGAPALHFLVLGALLFAVSRLASVTEPPRTVIEIGPARIERARAAWLARTGAPPSDSALRALVAAEIDEEVLLAEACARGFEESDPVVRARLARGVGFLEAEDERVITAGDARRVDDALSLGLARGDLVVRRRLLERMRAELALQGDVTVGEGEISARFARDAERFASPARVRLSHVFLARDRRGAALAADAARLRDRIVSAGVDAAHAIPLGDPFLSGHSLPPRTEADLARELGRDVAGQAFALQPGRWSEPIGSSYGLHIVFVHERSSAAPATLASARAQLREELLRERDAAALRRSLDALRARYEVRIGDEGT